jgi:CheY-like chemotaxis protein
MLPPEVRILLIEDDPDDAELLVKLLEGLGCSANMIREGLLALGLRRLQTQGFDLVFLDLSLPDSWGMDTLRRLRKVFPKVPVVLMTGAALDEIAEEAMLEGAAACVFKQDLSASRLASILSDIVGL